MRKYSEARMLVSLYAKKLVEDKCSYQEWMETMDRLADLRKVAEQAWKERG